MRRGRLPLTALRSFEVAGRLLSFSKAADELFVSQAAISRQIRELEAFTGYPLFERHHRRVSLTGNGVRLLEQLTASFDDIDRRLAELRATLPHETLTVSVEPSFAGMWLVSKLNAFGAQHPDIDVSLSVDPRVIEFRGQEAELAIRFSAADTAWPRTRAEHLLDISFAPVLSPALLASTPPLRTPDDLRHHTLLHDENRNGWSKWFEAAGVGDIGPQRGPIFTDSALATQAARLGHGIALGDIQLLRHDLEAGTLVMPFGVEVACGVYWLVEPDFKETSRQARAFADWLKTELRAEPRI
ncbi:MAG TPA: LysR substrate-binding domain-containing protein [Mesorhizobium sp.]|nr:LysR substrate-binding domain-containing protein [Mesorhizobium sp.]